MLLLAFVAARSTPNLPSLSVDLLTMESCILLLRRISCMQHFLLQVNPDSPSGSAFRGSRFHGVRLWRSQGSKVPVPRLRFQVPGGVRNPAWGRGMGMRHRGGAKCACRVDPSTSGGAAENTSSMYACNPPEGPSMCQRAQNRSPYYFTPTVAGSSSRDSYVHTCNELLDQFLDPSCNPVVWKPTSEIIEAH
eukprot:scaffold13589_cov64-Phaeocystis_antarctica.AAC.2